MMSDKYAVIGNPIAHSKSPSIHQAFAKQTGEDLEYGRILGEKGRFDRTVADFIATGGKGLNITVPFKEDAWRLADERSDRAETAGAVNTLILLQDGNLRGDNTDGVGLVRDLSVNHGCELAGAEILLLGAGGATRGVLRPLLEAGPQRLTIANRTASKALTLVQECSDLGEINGCGLEQLKNRSFDIIINGTSAGLDDNVPDIPDLILRPNGWVYDMMYGDKPTAFMRWGQEHGASKALGGLGMLVEQAAESFFLWRGVRPETAPVIAMLQA
jgi:shikimate dehydrogenase